MKKRYKILIVFGILTLLLFSLFNILFFILHQDSRIVAGSSQKFLSIKLYGDIFDASRKNTYSDLLFPARSSILKYIWTIQRAKFDNSVKGIIIHPQNIRIGWANILELRDALADFRQTGKPVFAFLEYATTRDYYLASVANKIYLTPTGTLALIGLFAETIFLKDILNKLGIKANFVQIGKYKTAANTYTHNTMTPPQAKMINQLLDDFYQEITHSIADSRELSQKKTKKLIDNGPFSASKAAAAGLVDSLVYKDEFDSLLREFYADYTPVEFHNYLNSVSKLPQSPFRQKIALIFANGTITSGSSSYNPFYGEMLGAQTINHYLQRARKDNSIKAIVLRINSPGGSALASDLIWREIILTREQKPVIVSMANVAASGGYYMAMAADTIVAHPTTITGSIGVFAGKFNFKGFYQKIGINKEIISRGKNATIYHDDHNFSPRERQIILGNMQEFYNNFVSKAAKGRKMSYAEIENVAQGKVWSGIRAQQAGLVDTLGSLITALKLAKKMANLPQKQGIGVVVYPERKSLLEQIRDQYLQYAFFGHLFYQPDLFPENANFLSDGNVLSLLPLQISIR